MTDASPDGPLLAIVIPAYKATFLDDALASIAAQTDRRFRVYVGDDASPHDLCAICDRWADRLPLQYHRFQENLGGRDLVGQWHRCINLSHEPWIWLFSDDDVMDSECVAAFYNEIERAPAAQVLHFNTLKIDEKGQPGAPHSSFPPRVMPRLFALQRFTGQLRSYVPEYIFSRTVFDQTGGFPNFPLAWCSDNAGWISMGGEGIFTIDGPRVSWRVSCEHISNRAADNRNEKWQASIEYMAWLNQYLTKHPAAPGEPSDREIMSAGIDWLIRSAASRRSLLVGRKFIKLADLTGRANILRLAGKCLRADLRTWMRRS